MGPVCKLRMIGETPEIVLENLKGRFPFFRQELLSVFVEAHEFAVSTIPIIHVPFIFNTKDNELIKELLEIRSDMLSMKRDCEFFIDMISSISLEWLIEMGKVKCEINYSNKHASSLPIEMLDHICEASESAQKDLRNLQHKLFSVLMNNFGGCLAYKKDYLPEEVSHLCYRLRYKFDDGWRLGIDAINRIRASKTEEKKP